jgi:3'-5' exoribonuclease
LDRDLVVSGAILHDIGKVQELASGTRLEYTDKGKLIGHITLGDRIVADIIATIPDFPEKLENKLRHMIVSHHGERQYGSPVVPMTREAYVLHFVDKIDSGLNVFSHHEANSVDDWSNYVNLWERFLYFG